MWTRSLRGSTLALLAALALGVPALAQDRLAVGTWTGTVLPPPPEEVVDLLYEVSYDDEGVLSILLVPPPELGVGELPAGDVQFSEGTLSFTLQVGETVECALFAEADGHLEGECLGSGGESALMTMFPPEEPR